MCIFHRTADRSSSPIAVQIQGDRNRLRDPEEMLRDFAPQVITDMLLSFGKQAEELVAVARDLNARVVAISSGRDLWFPLFLASQMAFSY